VIHPARRLAFDDLLGGLRAAVAEKRVAEVRSDDGLSLFCYTNRCVYDKLWDDFSLMARGLILDPESKRVVATPFPKFFNAFELGRPIPDLPFEVFEKLDGSLIVIFHHNGRWRCATKGAFASPQAKWAELWMAAHDTSSLNPGATYLAEAIYPENRVVVSYPRESLTLLAAYDEFGGELSYEEVLWTACRLKWPATLRFSFDSFSDLIAHAKELPVTAEGFVIRFSNGTRLKVKGEEYCRVHRLVSRVTPLAVWEAMASGDDLEAMRRQLPEEFWGDFDTIKFILDAEREGLLNRVQEAAANVAHLTDKQVGLLPPDFPADLRPYVFAWRKSSGDLLSGRSRQMVYRAIRPDGNRLDGYAPSSAMNRVLDSDA